MAESREEEQSVLLSPPSPASAAELDKAWLDALTAPDDLLRSLPAVNFVSPAGRRRHYPLKTNVKLGGGACVVPLILKGKLPNTEELLVDSAWDPTERLADMFSFSGGDYGLVPWSLLHVAAVKVDEAALTESCGRDPVKSSQQVAAAEKELRKLAEDLKLDGTVIVIPPTECRHRCTKPGLHSVVLAPATRQLLGLLQDNSTYIVNAELLAFEVPEPWSGSVTSRTGLKGALGQLFFRACARGTEWLAYTKEVRVCASAFLVVCMLPP